MPSSSHGPRAALFALTLFLSWAPCVDAAGTKSSAGNLFPSSTVLYGEINDPREFIGIVLDHPLRQRIESLAPYEQFKQSPQYQQILLGVDLVQNHFEMPWRELLETSLHRSVAVGVDAGTQGIALVVHTKDAESGSVLLDKAIQLSTLGGDKIQKAEYRDVAAYRRNELRIALYQDRLLLTNNSDLGKSILDRMIDGDGENLYDNARFQAAWETRDRDAIGWAFLDVKVIRESGVADDVYGSQIDNPVAEMLLGGIQSTLGHTPYATADLNLKSQGIRLKVSMPHQQEWVPEHREYFFGPDGGGQAPNLLSVGNQLASISTHRDFAQLWLRAGDLFSDEINDEFAKADATLTTIFAGQDFGEDILGAIEPEVSLVVTRQDFSDQLPRPSIKIPAFALVMKMRDSQQVTRALRRTFQSMVGFFNVVGAMNGLNQLELDMEKLGGDAQLVTSQYVAEPDDQESTEAEILFNFSPTVGFNGDRFVLSSTIALARDLTMADPPEPELIKQNTAMNLVADVLKGTLADNREQLVAQNMLSDGNSREEAEAVIDLLLEVVGYFEDVSLSLETNDEELNIQFSLGVKAE